MSLIIKQKGSKVSGTLTAKSEDPDAKKDKQI